jgi:hypothetical protein
MEYRCLVVLRPRPRQSWHLPHPCSLVSIYTLRRDPSIFFALIFLANTFIIRHRAGSVSN